MSQEKPFDANWWEQHYQGHAHGHGAPGAQLVAEVAGLPVGTALDAGCGKGADAVWLARQGWQVTAIDVSPTAVRAAEELAATESPEVASRITWKAADLTAWTPPQPYDLVVSQYVHPDMPFPEFVSRLADAVAPDGTLLVVGHDHADRHSAEHAPAHASIGLSDITGALDPQRWEVVVAEARNRQSFDDFVVRARRKA